MMGMRVYFGRTCWGWMMYGIGDRGATWFLGFSRRARSSAMIRPITEEDVIRESNKSYDMGRKHGQEERDEAAKGKEPLIKTEEEITDLSKAVGAARKSWQLRFGKCSMCEIGDRPMCGRHFEELHCGNEDACELCQGCLPDGEQCQCCGRIAQY
jgi:hypothetical protein